jgi:hypothetical protein
MLPGPFRRPAIPAACACLLALLAIAAGGSPARAATTPPGVMDDTVGVNRLSMHLNNVGSFASDGLFGDCCYVGGGLEFPRGSGFLIGFAGGLWISGRATGSLRTAVTEYGTNFVPGPGAPGGPGLDTLRHRVFAVSRWDTAGRSAWMARAVPLGAPTDSAGTGPGLIGDRSLWTVYTDAGVTTDAVGGGAPRTPIGLEVQVTAYAFDRAPVLRDVVFLRYRLIHRGSAALDSTFLGLWYDADMRTASTPAASDSTLDLAYVYRTTTDVLYGEAGPATGVLLLRGPLAGGAPLRARSVVGYPNGSDPDGPAEYDRTLRGFYPWGPAMLDSTTGQPTLWFAWGDPVTGAGWLMPAVIHPKVALGMGPFTFAPGDTQVLDAAVIVGQGVDRAGSVVALRDNALEARSAFLTSFAFIPGPVPPEPEPEPEPIAPLLARPNPATSSVQFDLAVPAQGAQVRIEIFDPAGRRVRTLDAGWRSGGRKQVSWDGLSDAGGAVPTGVYFARARMGGELTRTRIVLIR